MTWETIISSYRQSFPQRNRASQSSSPPAQTNRRTKKREREHEASLIGLKKTKLCKELSASDTFVL